MMKKVDLSFLFLFFVFQGILFFDFPVIGQEKKEQELVLKEEVRVVNVEVPVRVFYKSEPVKDLTKDDFKLYENKKLQEIHGFYIIRKKMIETPENKIEKLRPRTFVLVFSITDYKDNVKEAVDYIFEKVLRGNDRLLVFVNKRSLDYNGLENKEKIKNEIKKTLKEQSIAARIRLNSVIKKIETELNINQFKIQLFQRFDQRPTRLNSFLRNYLAIWKDYKRKYLTPNIDRFYYFSKFLEKVKTEKWVLNFYQFELFPRIALETATRRKIREILHGLQSSRAPFDIGLAKSIATFLNQIDIELNVSQDFPVEEVSKLFHKVNATFHSFFMRSTRASFSNDFNYKQVSDGLERSLENLSKVTGGTLITSNNLVKSLDTVTEKEDYYYMLTYEPDNPDEKSRKIKVKVKNKKYKVSFDDNIRADYINEYLSKMGEKTGTPDMKIENFSFKRKILAFKLIDYLHRKINDKQVGVIKVRVKMIDKDNNVFYDQANKLNTTKEEMNISIPFVKLNKGEYKIFIEATDLFTNKNTTLLESIIVRK